MTSYSSHTPERSEVSGRRHRGLRLTSTKETASDRFQELLDQAGLSEVKVTNVTDQAVKVWCPDYAGWILAKKELQSCGLTVERT